MLSAMADVTWWNFYFRLGRAARSSQPRGVGPRPAAPRTLVAGVSSGLCAGAESGRVSVVALETARVDGERPGCASRRGSSTHYVQQMPAVVHRTFCGAFGRCSRSVQGQRLLTTGGRVHACCRIPQTSDLALSGPVAAEALTASASSNGEKIELAPVD